MNDKAFRVPGFSFQEKILFILEDILSLLIRGILYGAIDLEGNIRFGNTNIVSIPKNSWNRILQNIHDYSWHSRFEDNFFLAWIPTRNMKKESIYSCH